MCLTSTISIKKKSGLGYKVFIIRKGKLYGDFSSYLDCAKRTGTLINPRPTNVWIKSKDYEPIYKAALIPITNYKIGWHIFIDKIDLRRRGYFKVKYRKATVEGFNCSMRCRVAEEIFIIDKKKREQNAK